MGATQTLNNKTLNNAAFTGTLTVETIQVDGNTTIGNSSADSLTVNAASTFSASTTFANTLIAQQTLTVGSDITASGHVSIADDKIIKLGTDDDLQIKYTDSGDASSILDTSTGLTVGGADVQITDAAGTVKFFKGNATNSIVYHNDASQHYYISNRY